MNPNSCKAVNTETSQHIIALFIYLMLFIIPAAEAKRCIKCNAAVPDIATFCPVCLRAIGWPAMPERSLAAKVLVRCGRDAFIRGPNESRPGAASSDNAGRQLHGPIGSGYDITGLRYLIRFDIFDACMEADIDPASWTPEQATIVLHTVPYGDAQEDVPIVVYALARPFEEGSAVFGRHAQHERGCSWTMATGDIPWSIAGGDYFEKPDGKGVIPRFGAAEIRIDVTEIVRAFFEDYHKNHKRQDYGFILMRDREVPARCTYREIYSFENAPQRGEPFTGPVLTPELYLE